MEQDSVLTSKRNRASRAALKENIYGTAFVLLPLIGFLLFSAVPIGIVFVTMFCSMEGFDLGSLEWNGFANFVEVFTDRRFGKSLAISAYVTVGQLISLLLALATSAVLSQKLRGSKLLTVIFFYPVYLLVRRGRDHVAVDVQCQLRHYQYRFEGARQ